MMKRKRGGNFASNSTSKKSKRRLRKDSDDDDDYGSDEDYVLNEEDDNDEEEEEFIQGFLLPSSDEDSFEFVNKQEKKKVVRSKPKKNNSSSGINIGRREKSRVRQPVLQRTKGSNHVDDEEEAYEFDDDDEDDEDDVEFNPNEMEDFEDDEEDYLQVETRRSDGIKSMTSRKKPKNKKQKCASVPHRNESVRNHKVLRKPPKKKQRRLMVRSSTSSDDEFDLDYRARPQRNRKQNKTATDTRNRRRNKSLVDDDSDSDFVSSGPSDVECTVSDEEKELLKEANSFIGKPTTRTRNSSFVDRNLHLADASTCCHSRPLRLKGKEKVTTLQEDTGHQVCGICFSEEGKGIIRGTLDCCSHYFCYACIVEWSKIESRCPLCKQRFTSISKPARSNLGVDLRNTVIQVPKRDQVYQPSEEEVRGYLDPYDGVVCMECLIGGDDSLMLLCDICDSPAHTYCVGLGREVPEGNWYCRGCNPTTSTDLTPHLTINVEHTNPVCPPQPDESAAASPLASPSGAGVSTLLGRRRIHRQIHDFLFNPNRRIDETQAVVADSEDDDDFWGQVAGNSSSAFSPRERNLTRLRRGSRDVPPHRSYIQADDDG